MTKAVKIRFSTPHSGDLKIWVSLVIACGLPAKVEAIGFTREVRRLLVSRCGACHSERNSQGRFSIETQAAMLKGGASGPAITPGKTPASLLITRLTRDKPWHMARGNPLLSQMEIKLLSDWIDQGASGPALRSTSIVAKWIAPLAPRHPAPPNSAPNPIDAFLDIPNNQVSDAVFARRVFFDLWGLAPTPEQIV